MWDLRQENSGNRYLLVIKHARRKSIFVRHSSLCYVFLLVLIGFINCSFGHFQEFPKTVKTFGLRGPVKSMMINSLHRSCLTSQRLILYRLFNTDGYLTEERIYGPVQNWLTDSLNPNFGSMQVSDYTGLDTNKFEFWHKDLYHYNARNKLIAHARIDEKGLFEFREEFIYDELDSLIKEVYYNYDKGFLKDSSVTVYHFSSNSNSTIITIVYQDNDTSTVKLLIEKGKVVKKIFQSNDYMKSNLIFDYKFDLFNRCKDVFEYESDPNQMKLVSHQSHKYWFNKLKNTIDSSFYSGKSSSVYKYRFTYYFGSDKKLKRKVRIDNSHISTYYYNRIGEVIKEHNTYFGNEENSNSISTCIRKYKYDKYRNWLSEEKREFPENFPKIETSNRSFEYY